MKDHPAPQSEVKQPDIPGYTILEVAGRGGMGVVYKAQHLGPNRMVALKVLQRVSPAALADFTREAQVIASLEHPHIVPLYAFGEHQGAPYLTLRFLPGGSVADRIGKGPIAVETAVRWAQTVAGALDFAHRRGLVHRDVKPSNILLDSGGNAYLADFGIASVIASPDAGPAAGSAAYMPPEQGRGEPVDSRGDLYALAVSLFEMLTGQQPYTAETAFGVVVRHINDPIPSARALNPAIPRALDDLLQWTMAKLPGERPQSAGRFAALLEQALAHPDAKLRPVTEVPGAGGPARPPAVQPSSRSWMWLALAGAAALVCALGALVALASGVAALALLATSTPPPTAIRATAPATLTPQPLPTATLDADGGIRLDGETTRIFVLTNGIEWMQPLKIWDSADVVIEASALQESGPARNEIALLCRFHDQDNHVALSISGDGAASIWRKESGAATVLAPWTPSPAVLTQSGARNHLKATCDGPSLLLEVNGEPVVAATDPAPLAGDVAVMAGLREEGALVVAFDGLLVAAP